MKIKVYTPKSDKTETMDFPKERLVEPNLNLLSQASFVSEDRSHKGTARVKTRAEINATTAKMYKQKGTGNARHGSRRAPIFKGGGIAHGPHGVKRVLSLSKKLNKKAINMALSAKVKEEKAVVVDKLGALVKTKDAQKLVNTIFGSKKTHPANSKIVLALAESKKEVARAFRNIENVAVTTFKGLGIKDILHSRMLLIDKEALGGEPKKQGTKEIKKAKAKK